MNERCAAELDLLRRRWPSLSVVEDGLWVMIPSYPVPPGSWDRETIDVAFQIPAGLPAERPYGFYVRLPFGLQSGADVGNYTAPAATPFDGEWGKFSCELDPWQPAEPITAGTNMVNFVLAFANRLREGS